MRHWKKSSLALWQKKLSSNKRQNVKAYVCTMIVASFLATYLDLLFVGKGLYEFPSRPFPSIFSINILFTLVILPLFTLVIIFIFNRISRLLKLLAAIIIGLSAAIMEQIMEKLGMFQPSVHWQHEYSLVGYFIFVLLIWKFYRWCLSPLE